MVNSLWPSDAVWRHRSGSTLAQVMACCLTAPSHYLNQCRLIISKVHWHISKGNFIKDMSAIIIKISMNISSISCTCGGWCLYIEKAQILRSADFYSVIEACAGIIYPFLYKIEKYNFNQIKMQIHTYLCLIQTPSLKRIKYKLDLSLDWSMDPMSAILVPPHHGQQ